jgi:hypothetical protein
VKIDFEGRTWEFSQETFTVRQGMAIFLAYGLTIRDLLEGVQRLDVRAIQCDYWLMLQQNGIEKPIKDCEFDVLAFMAAIGEARDAEEAAEAAAAGAKRAGEEAALVPTSPLPDAPASPVPASPTATTPQPVAPMERPGASGTAY